MKFIGLFKAIGLGVVKHKSAILSGVAIITGVASTCLAVKATIEAVKDVEALKETKTADNTEETEVEVSKTEVIKTVWKHYIPVVVGTTVTIATIVCAHRVDAKKIAAATSALVLSERMRKELEHKTARELGADKIKEIKKTIFKENPDLDKACQDYQAGRVEVLDGEWRTGRFVRRCWFRDEITGREFFASKSEVEYAMIKAMREGLTNGGPYLTLNEFLEWLDLEPCVMGEMFGWDLSKQEIAVTYEPDQCRDTGEPCLIMHYYDKPRVI